MMQPRIAAFDLDGTLADTARDLINAANHFLRQKGLPELDYGATRNTVGMGGRALIRRGHVLGGVELTDDEVEEMYPAFLQQYEHCMAETTYLFDGVVEALDLLRRGGWRLGVCTNKPEYYAIELLRRLGVAEKFEVILGGDSLEVRKPDPAHLLATIERSGGHPEAAVMVGDSQTDLDTSKNLGVPCVLLSYGYSTVPVAELSGAVCTDSFREIPDLLDSLCPTGTSSVR